MGSVNTSETKPIPDHMELSKQLGENLIFGAKNIEAGDTVLVARKPVYIKGTFLTRSNDRMSSEEEKWLTVYPAKGRLGNQMFQIASMIGIADKYKYRPFIPSSGFDIDSVFEPQNFKTIIVDLSRSLKYQESGENTFAECDVTRFSDMSFLDRQNGCSNWTLDGYLQSYKHFWHIQHVLRKLFTFKNSILKEARRFINEGTSSNIVNIGIHVRRGDFLSEYHRSLGRVTPDEEYYKKAMDIYSLKYVNVTFYVFSNDITWCQGHLQRYGHKVVFSPFTQPGYDLAAISLCDHMIISVGTFGWWGGWLAGGSVIYFNGYPKSGSEISKYFIKEDFYPSSWLGII